MAEENEKKGVEVAVMGCVGVFFFFKQKTAYEIYQCDWSSDVCSSDLRGYALERIRARFPCGSARLEP